MPMRICIVMEYHRDDLIGGSEIQVFGLAREFARLGHDVFYICQRYDRAKPVVETIDGVRVLRALRWHRVFRFIMVAGLFRTVRRTRPDVVYQRSTQYLTGLAGLVARLLSVPFVWGCSEDEALRRDFLVRQQREAGSGRSGIKRLLLLLNAWTSQCLFHAGLRQARAVIVQNQRQLELLTESYGRLGTLIPNGVLVPREPRRPAPYPLVLWLNRIYRRKNAEAFVQLARDMQSQHPEARFVLVGGRQEDPYMRSVHELASGLENLQLVGNVPHADTEGWLRQAWIFVFTSRAEGFPNALLEAWAHGLPVVSLSLDPDGLIEKHGLGILSGTPEKLRQDVSLLLADSALRERLGDAGRAFVTQHFEFSRIAERYLQLFAGLR